jgi:hypothetical protein
LAMSAVSAAGYLGSIRWISRAPSSIAFCHDAISFLFSVRLRGTGGEAERTRMTLILRAMKKHMRWEDAKDDYVVLDGKKSIGRIYKEIHRDARWCWSINTSPYRRHRRTMASPQLSTRQSRNSEPGTRK